MTYSVSRAEITVMLEVYKAEIWSGRAAIIALQALSQLKTNCAYYNRIINTKALSIW